MQPSCDVLLLYPHQLFERNTAFFPQIRRALLVEDPLYFQQIAFHKQKLVLHRASMQMHAAHLRAAGFAIDYIEHGPGSSIQSVFSGLKSEGVLRVHYIDVVDDWLHRGIVEASRTTGLGLVRHETPMFITNTKTLADHFAQGATPRMARFYASQRLGLRILVEQGQPVGGRWSFDSDNRKRLPAGVLPPAIRRPGANEYVAEAYRYVNERFPRSPGRAESFDYPVTYDDARAWLEEFCQERLAHFGDYEDAISQDHAVLFHSVLTPLLNVGLLTPHDVIEAALARRQSVPLNSLEGFIRQVIGWREYVRGSYEYRGRAQRTSNFWSHTRSIPDSFWQGSTGILPVDTVILRILDSAYAHHIERLMVLGSFMLLCEFHPDQVYGWFMQMFIDAYDWVMVPNVYGMALYADGGRITTKPYLCGSNYILKMSDFRKGPWCKVWDGLYWRFIHTHREVLQANPRTQMMVRAVDRMSDDKRDAHLAVADSFLESLG